MTGRGLGAVAEAMTMLGSSIPPSLTLSGAILDLLAAAALSCIKPERRQSLAEKLVSIRTKGPRANARQSTNDSSRGKGLATRSARRDCRRQSERYRYLS